MCVVKLYDEYILDKREGGIKLRYMVQIILAVMAIFADILTILSVWGIDAESPLWLKIGITIVAITICVAMVVLTHDAYDIKVKRYHYKEKENEFRVYTRKNKYLVDGSVVSIYYRYQDQEEERDDLVALGYVFIDDKDSDVQIKMFKMIDERLVRNILSSNKSCRKYHVKPNVEFSRISEIILHESEASDNVC